MDCNRIQDKLVDYLTEDTRITERLCVEVHVATCYHCREAMDDVRTVLDAAKDSTRYAGPERSFDALMNEIRTREALLPELGRPANRWSWGVAAAALPIVVACVTPFVVAWPGGSRAVGREDAGQAVADTERESEVSRRNIRNRRNPAFHDRPDPAR